jgi:hypothetical protein
MGCDIHAHIEVKIKGKWEHYSVPSIQRSYLLFSKMAGVRGGMPGDPTPIAEPRGIPDDITTLTRFNLDIWEEDAHSRSWISGAEMAEIEKWHEEKWERQYPREPFGYLFNDNFGPPYHDGIEDVRIVFWFDN